MRYRWEKYLTRRKRNISLEKKQIREHYKLVQKYDYVLKIKFPVKGKEANQEWSHSYEEVSDEIENQRILVTVKVGALKTAVHCYKKNTAKYVHIIFWCRRPQYLGPGILIHGSLYIFPHR